MSVFHVTGGKPLIGEITVSGAKNAASKMLIATLLTSESVVLKNVPRQQETQITQEILEAVGAKIDWRAQNEVCVTTASIASTNATSLSRKNRISILALAPLLHRAGEAFVPRVGGDAIGPRPVNFHIDILTKMGAEISETENGYHAKILKRLKGTLIELAYPSVGATETAILAGVLAEGRTTIRNAAGEPEVKQLIMMLQNMGAIIQINSGRWIEIFGVEKLRGTEVTVMPDRIEAASYGSMAIGTRGEILVRGAEHAHMMTFLNAVRRIGGEYEVKPNGILFRGTRPLKGIELETDTHPGFMTDWQQPFVTVLTQAEGTSVVHETVYEERFGYTDALKKMGADITLFSNCLGESPCRFKGMNYKHSAVINGPSKLHAAEVEVPDIRAGLAFVVAALIADGTSTLTGIEHLDRGYENLEEKLRGVGADIKRE
ncbi:UDP-N-acetylglucosamine 1-carboxyvinyltransferase [Candidatus Uhrbacteria bacterium RIFCSPHIGHO2_02_FULL_47_44]|uniref:UDP-N-acetylglucosamine 1-carboxyvinyltransferase n=1 Tax=Candidatus Uhrbacteria bacterium RIFCSPLOWO2_02_FULL_48_18 TaxID=1802408 RepID=A0A1F7VCG0_9BACT|nr:MAG: UDP-N-acetylglucosamine 1-carboxyvinyltransferase [Candidatus Uhrbacteria bacterium RIFCSPHIGHO2_01_FULL_47_10]OGL69886.1 MAG: UDP-N-acetylglucosamine 1-carboxyvinyltransferase [Candidatus Uhrbacteria bacterium RIFCSPHIGHO2_02_FULL_47_44]OGL76727.1 MAG: UDP-N-acetylglucosamine 1-carboxyvinyltransferase [Candidatus Uhrbacteria bacterium RIFCSPHIGHO2_12_FULL_47_12]OGL80705.1 MAG: UDP-N-acetylglucosamine 1-carboxyvinyltransferase [Candidatus Uhrbacteria bacterium RIFCSPLOWO2_01_FULL_47_17]